MLILLQLKHLESIISVSFVHPVRDEKGWRFDSNQSKYKDQINGFNFLSEAYKMMDLKYNLRVTVPVLWDKKSKKIVNNESSDIIIMLNNNFNEFTESKLDFYPFKIRNEIDKVNKYIYDNINNGVYKCGFATSQKVYNIEVYKLFNALNEIDLRLEGKKFIVGDSLTLSDIRLFVTLIRFDIVYFNHFKTNLKHIYDYKNLWQFVKMLYNHNEIKSTTKFEEIKDHYFKTHPYINPSGIVPIGPNIEDMLKD